jgi:hypothetical protein
MSKLIGRKPIEVNINSLSGGVVPVYNSQYGGWDTISKNDLISSSVQLSGSNTIIGNQIISGSLRVTQTVSASLFSGSFYGIGDILAFSGSVATRLYNLELSASVLDAGTF